MHFFFSLPHGIGLFIFILAQVVIFCGKVSVGKFGIADF
jgi:hypothetical protein